ncbi:MAG: hypothetical protein JO153_20725 [Solirubrobacterales bacterium]|nr:hypothetical protein [Solirubrobacterales bacterium]
MIELARSIGEIVCGKIVKADDGSELIGRAVSSPRTEGPSFSGIAGTQGPTRQR